MVKVKSLFNQFPTRWLCNLSDFLINHTPSPGQDYTHSLRLVNEDGSMYKGKTECYLQREDAVIQPGEKWGISIRTNREHPRELPSVEKCIQMTMQDLLDYTLNSVIHVEANSRINVLSSAVEKPEDGYHAQKWIVMFANHFAMVRVASYPGGGSVMIYRFGYTAQEIHRLSDFNEDYSYEFVKMDHHRYMRTSKLMRDRRMALLMATHPRLGEASKANGVYADLLQKIIQESEVLDEQAVQNLLMEYCASDQQVHSNCCVRCGGISLSNP